MKIPLIIGTVLLCAALWLLFAGMHTAEAPGKTFSGRFSQGSTWYLVSGGIVGIAGAYLVFGHFRPRRRRFPGERR